MARPPASRSQKSNVKPGVNGREVHNKILLALPEHECAAVFAKLEFVSLPVPIVLNEVGEPIKFAFFLNDGLAPILNIMADGKSVEAGLCGKEGFVGISLTAGLTTSPARVIMQVAGTGFKLAAKDLIAAIKECPKLAMGLTTLRARTGAASRSSGGMQPAA